MFALYFDSQTRRVTALNGSGRASSALMPDRLKRERLRADGLPPFHPHTVTVPESVRGLV